MSELYRTKEKLNSAIEAVHEAKPCMFVKRNLSQWASSISEAIRIALSKLKELADEPEKLSRVYAAVPEWQCVCVWDSFVHAMNKSCVRVKQNSELPMRLHVTCMCPTGFENYLMGSV